MAQSTAPLADLNVLEEEVSTAESAFDLSAATAQILARVAAHSHQIASETSASAGSLATIASETTASAGSLATIGSETTASAGSLATIASETTASAGSLATIASETTASAGSLATIASETTASAGSLATIAKRGDRDCPVHVIIGERPLRVVVDFQQSACDALKVLLTDVCGSFPPWKDFCDLMAKCQELDGKWQDLDRRFRNHHHTATRNPPVVSETD